MKHRSAIKTDLFAADRRKEKIDQPGDPLAEMEEHIDFVTLAAEVDRAAPDEPARRSAAVPDRDHDPDSGFEASVQPV
jgi:hypothetical protein